ncbi:hypothetical protein SCAR479_09028 [Seiridium cardinale]|uniref:Uncharacterized protein n=1 Tax=Seiridium cardinale TaxID=138064 RepID=A0ABR2XKV9_9PEZI
MRVLTPLASLSWLIDSTLAAFRYMPAALNEMPLNKFQGSDGFNGGSGGAFWYNSIPIDRSVHMTLEEVYRIASGHFNWLKKEGDNHREVINFGTGGCLVPALWIPQTRVVSASCQAIADSLGVYWEPLDGQPEVEAELDTLMEDAWLEAEACIFYLSDSSSSQGKRYIGEDRDGRNMKRATACTATYTLAKSTSYPPESTLLSLAEKPVSTASSSSSSKTSSKASSTITTPPSKPSCYHQDVTPGNGASSAYCVCDKTVSLPELSQTAHAPVSQSCAYIALPTTSSKVVSIQTSTYTIDCQACIGVGGVENQGQQTYTKIPGCIIPTLPPIRVWLSNNTLSVGTSNNDKNGSTLLYKAYNGIKALCNGKTCDLTKNKFSIPQVPTVIHNSAGEGEGRIDDIKLGFTIGIANFTAIN